MAITKKLQDEAQRTIDGITRYYERYSDALDEADECEHKIHRIEESLSGCNGLSEKEKIQKTAENVFGLTCAWERGSLALNAKINALGAEMSTIKSEISELSTCMHEQFDKISDKIEASGSDGREAMSKKKEHTGWITHVLMFLDRHTGAVVFFLLSLAVLILISGHSDWIEALLK